MAGRKPKPPAADAPAARRTWAELLDARREKLQMSIDELAAAITEQAGEHVDRKAVEMWRRAKSIPPVERWPAIAAALRYKRFRDFLLAWAKLVEGVE